MTNSALLEAEIRKSGLKKRYIAEQLDIAPNTFINKINNKSDFTAPEVGKISELLNLSDANIRKIFLS